MTQNNNFYDCVREEWLKIKPKIETLFKEQWDDPELPGMEIKSYSRLANWLEENNFQVTHSPYNIPTAFIADSDPKVKGPTICILAEYDALPGLSLKNSPEKHYKNAGHGCGHNHIGPANVGAAIAAANACKFLKIPGNIKVVGCPAEEILWGKIALFNNGAFSNIDCILTSHGDYQNGSISRPCQSVVSGELVFEGQSGHGGNLHENNALNAAEKTIFKVESELQKEFPNILFRHVIRQAGLIPTITPEECRVWYTTRGFDFIETQNAYEQIIATGKEVSSGLNIKFHQQFISETKGYLPNDTIGKKLFESLKLVGPPKWTSDDIKYMNKLVQKVAPGKKMSLDKDIQYYDENEDYFGQDDGEVSWRIPLGRINWAYPMEIPIHHWAWTELSGNKASNPGPLMASEAIALTSIHLLNNTEIIKIAKEELRLKTQNIKITKPKLGAFKTITTNPKSFWDGTWQE